MTEEIDRFAALKQRIHNAESAAKHQTALARRLKDLYQRRLRETAPVPEIFDGVRKDLAELTSVSEGQ